MGRLTCECRRSLAVLAWPHGRDLLRAYAYLHKVIQPPGVANAPIRLCIQFGAAGAVLAVLLVGMVWGD